MNAAATRSYAGACLPGGVASKAQIWLVGEFLDFFEVKDPPYDDFSEKARCSWGGTAQGIGLFFQQRAAECRASSCGRLGAYVSRNVGKSFCALFELYTVDHRIRNLVATCHPASRDA